MPATIQVWGKRIFVNRNVFNLWMGQVISQAGDSIYEMAMTWLLLELTGSNAVTGLIAMSAYLPMLLFGLYSGAIVDRFDRRRLMLISDILRAGIVLIIPLLYWLDGLSGLAIGLVTFVLASFNALFLPARDAIVGELAEPRKRIIANSMIQTAWTYALFLGPVIAGILLAIITFFQSDGQPEIHLFTADAFTFLLSFYFIYKITLAPKPEVKTDSPMSFGQQGKDVWQGLLYAWKDKRIFALLLVTAADNIFLMGPALIGAPIFIREILHQELQSYAFIQVAYAIGMVAGTILLNRYRTYFKSGHILIAGIILDGLTFFPLLWVKTLAGMFITIVIHAMAIPMIIVIRPTVVQDIVPREMQGRIFSMVSIAVYGLTAISIGLTGVVTEFVPINQLYAIIAVLAAATGVIGWLIPEFRRLE